MSHIFASATGNSVLESWMISCSACYNKELGVFAEVMNSHVDEYTAMWGQDVADITLKGMERIQNLKLTKEEMAIFRAMCITSTDREFHIEAKAQLEEVNWRYVQCLRYLTYKKGMNFERRFSQIINAVLCMREGCEMFSNLAIIKPNVWPELRENPIAYEVFFT
ncbi:hypothetical protein CHS0354_040744 [Potamilus streckersoni]|uniref:NR LBD domain-containing protein n=1 Tax=Potamilus streckersoni TaxID=2493646 RepID=A0AAE0VX99_9BIVA|nr:hypothetical protein CHS0354_040744 [Potamilus streckersoni]